MAQVADGYRLPQPHSCSDELYAIMTRCWNPRPAARPLFPAIITTLLAPLEKKLQSPPVVEGKAMRPLPPIPTEEAGLSKDKKTSNKKVAKVKELNYFSVASKVHFLLHTYAKIISVCAYVVHVCL